MIRVVKGKEEATVEHIVDLKGWLDAGWKVKGEESTNEPKETARDILIKKATELELQFYESITNKDLKALIEESTKQ